MGIQKVILSNMEKATTDRDQVKFLLDPSSQESRVGYTTLEKEELDELAEEYGFPSRSSFLRHMVQLGMNTLVQQDPTRKTAIQSEDSAVTIRELIPKGKENAVDVRDELPELIEEQLLDIVDRDTVVEREGWMVYR